MKVWITQAVLHNDWKMIVDDDTGDVSPELQVAAHKILDLEDSLQDARYEAMGEDL